MRMYERMHPDYVKKIVGGNLDGGKGMFFN